MNKYEIKFQKGVDMLIQYINANNSEEAIYLFYMNNPDTSIESMELVEEV